MTRKYEEEITANLERAQASLQAAQDLMEGGYYDFVASRAYYGAFYAATALLLCEELEFGKHSGVIAFIHRAFIKTGKLDKRYGRDLNWLFELRGIGDYGATIHVSRQDAEKAIKAAEQFLRAAEGLILFP
ncbi:MAG TPA: HEPN domain-containing protein [Chloroflexi bacterium]|nr:HEPN domain-containing protein [Chloroflexota bacterium]